MNEPRDQMPEPFPESDADRELLALWDELARRLGGGTPAFDSQGMRDRILARLPVKESVPRPRRWLLAASLLVAAGVVGLTTALVWRSEPAGGGREEIQLIAEQRSSTPPGTVPARDDQSIAAAPAIAAAPVPRNASTPPRRAAAAGPWQDDMTGEIAALERRMWHVKATWDDLPTQADLLRSDVRRLAADLGRGRW
jgi:hypothetical protein